MTKYQNFDRGKKTESLKNLYERFLKQVDYKISYTPFCKLKPFWVVSQKVHEKDTCLCKKHANIQLLMKGLFKFKIVETANVTQFAQHV